MEQESSPPVQPADNQTGTRSRRPTNTLWNGRALTVEEALHQKHVHEAVFYWLWDDLQRWQFAQSIGIDVELIGGSTFVQFDPEGAQSPSSSRWNPEEDFVVERIVGRRIRFDTVEYRVQWKDSSSTCTWEPVYNLSCNRLLREYELRRQARRRRP